MGYRCIGIDIRGFGNSDKPWKGYNYDRLADDVRYVVESLKLQDFILAGHSVGGAIAIRYMARHNGYGVSKLALFAAAAPSFTNRPNFPYGLPKEDVTKLIQETDESLFSDLRKICVPTLILHGIHDKICPFSLAIILRKGFKNSKLVPLI